MERFLEVPIGSVKESPLNPRQHYDEVKINELAESIKGVGIIEPLVVRSANGRGAAGAMEIIVGSRRYRAANVAGVEKVPVIVRELDDAEVLEIMVIENNQREDVNALEEAEGYKRLLEHNYALPVLSEKIGRSKKYIYDRLKLLELVPEAKKLLLANRITPGHAILLARLKPKEQERAIDVEFVDYARSGGVFQIEMNRDLDFEEPVKSKEKSKDPLAKYRGFKARSVRELEAWIDEYVRFDKKEPVDEMLFPETAATLKEAAEEKLKVVQITHNYQTRREAKEGNAERIFHSTSWKLADGSDKDAKECQKSVVGVIVVGSDRGRAHKVCVNKNCDVHWGKEKHEREKQKKQGGSVDRWRKEQERQHARWQAEEEKRDREQKQWQAARTDILQACAVKIETIGQGALAEVLYGAFRNSCLKEAGKFLSRGKSVEQLLRFLAMANVINEFSDWNARIKFPKRAKQIGVDVAKILKEHAPKETKPGTYAEPTCVHCGCTESKGCVLIDDEVCSWLQLDKKTNAGVCSAPKCAAQVQTSGQEKTKRPRDKKT